jgi:hypothetical protein
MRDGYSKKHHAFVTWRTGAPIDPAAIWPQWFDLVRPLIARGGFVHRARIVSEPISEYIRFEHSVTSALNIAAGEEVRWLPRRHASDLALPGNDFWLFDDRVVIWNFFTGEGDPAGNEVTEDPALVRLCSSAFRTTWERAAPHEDYRPS